MSAVRSGTGSRLLHIGPHKTGTSAIQGALYLARERLAAEGISYPGRGRAVLWPILAVTGQPPLLGEPRPKISYWENLVAQIAAAGDQRVVLSSEFFAQADDATARRVVTDLGGERVHVVVTLRSLTRILPSQWQQYIQNGFHFRYLDWLEGILSDPPSTPTPGFWLRHRHDMLVARQDADAALLLPVEAAARAALGAFIAGGADGTRTAEQMTGELGTRSLAGVLASRCRQRVRRARPR
jgi:hypothetical protein